MPTTSSSPRKRAAAAPARARRTRKAAAGHSATPSAATKPPKTYPQPPGRAAWRLDWFLWFLSRLELPEGGRSVIDPWTLLVLKEVFTRGRVELLVLLPKGNGKTTLFGALAVFHLLVVRNAQVFIAAADKAQADEMYRFARHFVDTNPELRRLLVVRASLREIRTRRGGGMLKVLASDKSQGGGKRHSYSPTLALIDELHAHENDSVYVALRSAIFKRNGLIVTITTAGHDHDGVLGQLRAGMLALDQRGGTVRRDLCVNAKGEACKGGRSRRGRLTIARAKSNRTVMLEWACRGPDHPQGPDDLTDLEIVKLANPASFVTYDSLADAAETPGIKPGAFARYRANVWLTDFDSWLAPGSWSTLTDDRLHSSDWRTWEEAEEDELYEHIDSLFPTGASLTAMVDMARYRDCAAITLTWKADRPVQKTIVWRSGGELQPIAYGPIEQALRFLDEFYDVWAIGWDPKYFDRSAELLEGQGLPMVKFDQSPERMSKASDEYRKAVMARAFAHDGDPIFAAHVAAGTAKDIGVNQWRIVKKKRSGPPIDAAIAGAGSWLLHIEGVDARAYSGSLLEVF